MGQTRQGVQRLSDEMVKAGFLAYEDNPFHKKAKLVTLTPKGEEIFQEVEQKQIPWANENSAEISAQEMEVALGVLKKMVRKLNR